MIGNLRITSETPSRILFALFVWSLLILRFGYRFGTGDQVEVLPYTLLLNDPSLYPHDFVLQALHATVPNERTVIAYLLLPFVNHLEIACFLLHLLTTVLLVTGLMRLAEGFIQQRLIAWLAVPVSLIVFNDYGLGNLELYTDCLQAGFISVAIIAWALVFLFNQRYTLAVLLMSVASIMHGLEGLDVMAVLFVLLMLSVQRNEITLTRFMSLSFLYLLIAGGYLVTLFVAKQGDSSVSNKEFFEIMYRFRHPHHFIFSLFPKFKMAVFFLLTISALLYFRKHAASMFQFLLISTVGLILYIISVDGLQNVFIGNFQFYRVTPWMKFFGVLAFFGWMVPYIPKFRLSAFTQSLEKPIYAAGVVMSWLIICFVSTALPFKVDYQLFGLKNKNDMISICRDIKLQIPRDAVFVQPFENSELKYYSERSSYVEFKANVHDKKYVGEWYRRIQLVFGISVADAQKGFLLKQKADIYYKRLTVSQLQILKDEGVTHLLVQKNYSPSSGSLILFNDSYAVYQL